MAEALADDVRSGVPAFFAGRPDALALPLAATADGVIVAVRPGDVGRHDALAALHARLAPGEAGALDSLAACRDEIDRLDDALLALIARRMQATDRAGDLKRMGRLAVRQGAREAAILARLTGRGGPHVGPGEVAAIWQAILRISRARQRARHG